MRTPHGRFPEYHTSADDLDFVKAPSLGESFARCLDIISVLDDNRQYLNTNPKCEPQLGKRGLYRMSGGRTEPGQLDLAMLWVLNLADGNHSLLDVSQRAALPFELACEAAHALTQHGLLVECRT